MKVLNFLKEYWVIIVFVVGTATAWGEQRVKINSIADVVVEQSAIRDDFDGIKDSVNAININQAVTNERLDSFEKQQSNTNETLNRILMKFDKLEERL